MADSAINLVANDDCDNELEKMNKDMINQNSEAIELLREMRFIQKSNEPKSKRFVQLSLIECKIDQLLDREDIKYSKNSLI